MNKRQLKKQIQGLCAGLAVDTVIASDYIPSMNPDQVAALVADAAKAQTQSLRRLSLSFDKTPRDFETRREYRKARAAYFKAAFAKLRSDLNAEADKIVSTLNSALSEQDKEVNKAKATEK